MAERICQQFGQYRLIRVLGHGSFGEVYLGEHIHKHTLAAVKLFDNGCCLCLSSREGVHTKRNTRRHETSILTLLRNKRRC